MNPGPGDSAKQKAEQRKAHAAQLRAEEKRRERSRRIVRWSGLGVGAILLAGLVTFVVVSGRQGAPPSTASTAESADTNVITEVPATPAIVAKGASRDAPWPAPANASGRAAIAGLPMLTAEGTVEHIHSHLSISIEGKGTDVPADIGIDLAQQKISPLHTHDTTGIIHVESTVKRSFTLGQVFTEWDVALDATRIGSYSTTDGHSMTVFVDGRVVTGDPAAIVLADHEDIAIVYAKAGETATAPAAFAWPDGY
ncbi:MAG: hypothetical protein JWO18_996 [Microbacteriaceae bacterium]|nr:hypothetical protein [Microbacteriaceae bacterium]